MTTFMSLKGRASRARQMKKTEVERKHSLDIEKWLKSKFREGFVAMKTAFEELDVDKAGIVSTDIHKAYFKVKHNVKKKQMAQHGIRHLTTQHWFSL